MEQRCNFNDELETISWKQHLNVDETIKHYVRKSSTNRNKRNIEQRLEDKYDTCRRYGTIQKKEETPINILIPYIYIYFSSSILICNGSSIENDISKIIKPHVYNCNVNWYIYTN